MSKDLERERAARHNAAEVPESTVVREMSTWAAHLRTVGWLRWRLWQRRWYREGPFLRGFGVLATGLAVVMGCLCFLLALGLGIALFPLANPAVVLITWGALIGFFVAVRVSGVLVGLQRGDGLPLDNLLHLPFSPHQVFLLNFALSQLTLSTVIFVPAFLGLGIASAVALDFRNVVLIPASLALVLCVAAVIYQVQGWIVSAMVSKRNRVALGALLFMALVLLIQIPHLYRIQVGQEAVSQQEATGAAAASSDNAHDGDPRAEVERMTREYTGVSSQRLPRGWVAHGSADGPGSTPWLTVAATISLLAMTILSLRGSYRATLARYRDGHTRAARPQHERAARPRRRVPSPGALESPVVAIARVTLQQWLRSVHGKMALLAPLVLLSFVFMSKIVFPGLVDADTLPLTAIGVMTVVGVPLALSCNLFAFDGHGFYLYRFAGVPPKTLLLGKCLALLPQFVVLAGAALTVVAVVGSILATHVLATVFQGGIVFLACCVTGSALSMRLPYAVSLTSMNSRGRPSTGLLALLVELVVAASLILIAAGALAAEQAFHEAGHEFPVYLVLSMLEFGVSVVGFRVLLGRLARELVERSDHILDTVAVIN